MKARKIQGEIQNLKPHIKQELESLYDLSVPVGQLSTKELNERLVAVTEAIGREVAAYVDRKGRVIEVSVGSSCPPSRRVRKCVSRACAASIRTRAATRS